VSYDYHSNAAFQAQLLQVLIWTEKLSRLEEAQKRITLIILCKDACDSMKFFWSPHPNG
jgi:hypothetical protein